MNPPSDVEAAPDPQGAALREAKRALRRARPRRTGRAVRGGPGCRVARHRRSHARRAPTSRRAGRAADDSVSQRMGHRRRSCAPRWPRARPSRCRASTVTRGCWTSARSSISRATSVRASRTFPSRWSTVPCFPATRSISSSFPASRTTREGRRLGYGGGYYDRLLPLLSPRAARVAGAFDVQIVDRVPVGPNDVTIDAVVTESRELSMPR